MIPPVRNATRAALFLVTLAVPLTVVVVLASGSTGSGTGAPRVGGAHVTARHATRADGAVVTVQPRADGVVPAGFLGLSMEFDGLTTAGGPVGPFDPVLAQLIRNLAPGTRPVLRIGGESTDYSWWSAPGLHKPGGVHYALTPGWINQMRGLTQATNARLILGINLSAASRQLAAIEARALVTGIGQQWVLGLEPGNEPELYPSLPPLVTTRTGDNTRQRYGAFSRRYTGVTGSLPGGALAGPSFGSDRWLRYLSPFLRREPRVRVVTVHRYPLKHCEHMAHTSINELLAAASSAGLAQSVRASVNVAHAHGLALRVDELNSVSCGGEAGVSDTFASALWALNTLFEMARVGIDGVNVHTRPLSLSQVFDLSRRGSAWRAAIRPEYYGLLAFADAAPANSRLLRIVQPRTPGLNIWATRAPSGAVHVVLINQTAQRRTLALRLPAPGPFSTMLLKAGGLSARRGITLGGQSFGPMTTTGLLAGAQHITRARPVNRSLGVRMAPFSAMVLSSLA